MKKHYLPVLFLSLLVFNCKDGGSQTGDPDHSNLKIVLSDSLAVEDEGGALRLPKTIRELSDVLVSNARKCDQVFVFDPSLIRLDQPKEFSLVTKIEKGGAKKTTHPKVISKLIGKNLDDIDVPEAFVKASGAPFRTATQVQKWLTGNVPNDSIVVYNPNGSEKYTLGKQTYPTFADVEAIREYMRNALCQNAKANFTLLYNPPKDQTGVVISDPGTTTTISVVESQTKTTLTTTRTTKKGGYSGRTIHHPPTPDGICDYDTHTLYDRVRGEDGRDKRGKVLIMNCKECGYIASN